MVGTTPSSLFPSPCGRLIVRTRDVGRDVALGRYCFFVGIVFGGVAGDAFSEI